MEIAPEGRVAGQRADARGRTQVSSTFGLS